MDTAPAGGTGEQNHWSNTEDVTFTVTYVSSSPNVSVSSVGFNFTSVGYRPITAGPTLNWKVNGGTPASIPTSGTGDANCNLDAAGAYTPLSSPYIGVLETSSTGNGQLTAVPAGGGMSFSVSFVATPPVITPQSISNGIVTAALDASGTLSATSGGTTFFSAPFAYGSTAFEVSALPPTSPFGPGQMLVDVASGDRIALPANSPFVLVRRDARGRASNAPHNGQIVMRATLDLGVPASQLRGSGTNGLFNPASNPGQHLFTAIADPATNRGVVVAPLTIDAGSPVIMSSVSNGKVVLTAQDQYGAKVPSSLAAFGGEWWAIGLFADARAGLEQHAEAFAAANDIELPHCPVALMTWYCEKYGGALNQTAIHEISQHIQANFGNYGWDVLQIDDLWQNGITSNGPAKDFSQVRPNGPYSNGMVPVAGALRQRSQVPGLWLLPFGTNEADPALPQVSNFIVHRRNGNPYTTNWSGTAIDSSHPDGYAYVREMIRRTVQDWGYSYLKLDGIHMAMATSQTYPYRTYRSDAFEDAVFANPDMSNMQVGRRGLDAVREGAGPATFLLGCASTQNERSLAMCLGKFDAMRVGPDSSQTWAGTYSIVEGVRAASSLYFQNGRTWWLDPDSIYARNTSQFPENEVRTFASFVTVSGMLNNISDWTPDYPAKRIELLRATMPVHQLATVRPIDYFENDPARIWHLWYDVGGETRHTVGLFNWSDQPLEIALPVERLGLSTGSELRTLEFWSRRASIVVDGVIRATLPPRSCEVLSVCPDAPGPILLGSSRHITHGAIDLRAVESTPEGISGRTELVANHPTIIVVSRNGVSLGQAQVSPADVAAGVTISFGEGTAPAGSETAQAADADCVHATILSPTAREVNWSFKPALVNGDFESAAEPGRALAGWYAANPAGVSVASSGSGSALRLAAGSAIYQPVGAFEVAQGTQLHLLLDQLDYNGSTGAIRASLHGWDGIAIPADGSDCTHLAELAVAELPAVSAAGVSRVLTFNLSTIPPGQSLWLRIAAGSQVVRLDNLDLQHHGQTATTGFDNWAFTNGLARTDAGRAADPDGDGLDNLLEYALLGMDPLAYNSTPLQAQLGGEGEIGFEYRPRVADDVQVTAEYQRDRLDGPWLPLIDGVDGLKLVSNGDTRRIEVVDPPLGRLFARLRANRVIRSTLPVTNSSGEQPDRTGLGDAYSTTSPAGWALASSFGAVGVEEIRDSRYGTAPGPEGSRLNAMGGEGDQVLYLNMGNTATASATAASDVIAMIEPNTTYTLTIAFGQRVMSNTASHPNGRLGLTTNGVELPGFTSFTGPSLATGFTDKTYTWASPGPGDPLIGQPLRIRMTFNYATNYPAGFPVWQQAQFDNVRLAVQSTP